MTNKTANRTGTSAKFGTARANARRKHNRVETVIPIPDETVVGNNGVSAGHRDASVTTKADGTRALASRAGETTPIRCVETASREELSRTATLLLGKLMSDLEEVTDTSKTLLLEHGSGCRCRVCVCGREMEDAIDLVGRMCALFRSTLGGF